MLKLQKLKQNFMDKHTAENIQLVNSIGSFVPRVFHVTWLSHDSTRISGSGGGVGWPFNMRFLSLPQGMLVRKFEVSPQRRQIWAWLELYFTPQRYHLARDRVQVPTGLIITSIFYTELKRLVEIEPKMECTLKDTLTSKRSSILSSTS